MGEAAGCCLCPCPCPHMALDAPPTVLPALHLCRAILACTPRPHLSNPPLSPRPLSRPQACAKEVMRLYPAIPVFPREAMADDVLPTGHAVSAGGGQRRWGAALREW